MHAVGVGGVERPWINKNDMSNSNNSNNSNVSFACMIYLPATVGCCPRLRIVRKGWKRWHGKQEGKIVITG